MVSRTRKRSKISPTCWRFRPDATAFACFGIEEGFETPDFAVIAEQDILGDRLVRQRRKRAQGRRRSDGSDEPFGRRSRRSQRSRYRPVRRTADHHGARRAARLPRTSLRRRRQAVSPRREHRASVALRRAKTGMLNSTGSAALPGSRARRGSRSGCARSPTS